MARSSKSLPVMLIVVDVAAAMWCIGLIVFGALRLPEVLGTACLATGALGLVVIAVSIPIAGLVGSRQSEIGSQRSIGPAAEQLLTKIYENSMLSDNAKRVLFRDRELQLLRRAIEDDIAHGDYSAGLTLCDDMANLFGHREEAEAYRTRILQAGHASYEARVHQALEHFEATLASRDWAAAHREAAAMRRLYPTHHLVHDIDQRILQARQDHKRELESQFIEAANRDDVAAAMALLKHLDRYLTRDEASRLAEIAQNVVVKHRDNLSTQFKLAVSDHHWAQATRIGEQIIAEFPNAKMADEVRSMIDVLRVRATQAAVMAEG
jgi:hypothetical protein